MTKKLEMMPKIFVGLKEGFTSIRTLHKVTLIRAPWHEVLSLLRKILIKGGKLPYPMQETESQLYASLAGDDQYYWLGIWRYKSDTEPNSWKNTKGEGIKYGINGGLTPPWDSEYQTATGTSAKGYNRILCAENFVRLKSRNSL